MNFLNFWQMQIEDLTTIIGLFSGWVITCTFIESDIDHKKHCKCSMCLLKVWLCINLMSFLIILISFSSSFNKKNWLFVSFCVVLWNLKEVDIHSPLSVMTYKLDGHLEYTMQLKVLETFEGIKANWSSWNLSRTAMEKALWRFYWLLVTKPLVLYVL